jgi:peptidoglycan hydrolase-like protein with peptidoglycan-binding domain/DNA invertase Pin-like site-specific DNA recombinase
MKPKCFAHLAQGRLIGRLMVCLAISLTAVSAAPALAAAASPQGRAGQDAIAASGSGTLHPGAGYNRGGGSPQVRALQRRLQQLNQRPGPVDGLYGPLTRGAVQRFQAGHGLVRDGVVGPRTRRAMRHPRANEMLRSGVGYELRNGSPPVRRLQRGLRRLGQNPGAIDGRYGPLTQRAVERIQAHSGLSVDGIAGPQTRRALARGTHHAPKAAPPTRSAPQPRSSTPQPRSTPKPHSTPQPRSTPQPPTRITTPPSAPARPNASPSGGNDSLPTPLIALASALALLCLVGLLPSRQRHLRPRLSPVAFPASDGTPVAEPDEDGRKPLVASRVAPVDPVPVLGYLSVPRAHSDHADDDTAEQTEAIDRACRERGLRLLEVVRDVESDARRALDRPGLTYALDRISEKAARGLVVSRLESVSRSAPDIGVLVERLEHDDARFVAVDFGLDTGTKAGRIAARTLMTVCDMERRRLSDHTRRGLAAARARGSGTGRPAVADHADLKARIARLRAEGSSFQAIADLLNTEGVPTLRGGAKWRPSSVQAATGYKRPTQRTTRNSQQGSGA